jgi:PHD/YefM family antitoxin component YafN of YafNO toxin-antitoxin module
MSTPTSTGSDASLLPVDHPNPTIDMTKVGKSIRRLHDQVCDQKRRVEITRAGSDDVCVMISKKELESLEAALQIFADTEAFEEMCEHLRKLLATAHEVYGPAPEPVGQAG